MKKLLFILAILIIVGCFVERSTCWLKRSAPEPRLDTISTVWNDNDSMYFVVNEYQDTVDWWGYSRGVKVSKKHFETIMKTADTLLMSGYIIQSKEN